MTDATYYHAITPEFEKRPALADEIEADVCVIGGGLTGISAALHFAERGFDTVLLEAGRIGDGASGRNGGQICMGYSCGMPVFERTAGMEQAKIAWDMASEAIGDINARIERHGIAAGYRRGYLHAALNARQLGGLEEMAESWSGTYGFRDMKLLSREETAAATGSEIYRAALLEQGSGHMNPLAYLRGLAFAAEKAGARLFEDSRVTGLARGSRVALETEKGKVRARQVVLAGNAYLGSLLPEIEYRIAPVLSAVAATAPLPPELTARILPGDEAVADSNTALNYFRKTPDNRLLFGGLASYSGRPLTNAAGALRKKIAGVYPKLAEIDIDYCWSGKIAITFTRMPDFGRIDGNIYYAQGYSGHGVALTGLAGKLIAEAMAGDAERFDLFAKLPNYRFPGGPARTALLALGMTWYKLRDLVGLSK
ncbi:FAD-binding oxidoreductase [Nisaea acidiphila]|uniref:FAD-binding oxidoreductase n=1 Tax=Nisaea acidiphila TaxID=1862145 RepID=A0A9J7AWB0_9PROT|nr:FAD-binding oxidoreductase [Nisaea acidiphila]UUX50556.1 FAD-binding oxidoreductase [Nisaea acidiphila]